MVRMVSATSRQSDNSMYCTFSGKVAPIYQVDFAVLPHHQSRSGFIPYNS